MLVRSLCIVVLVGCFTPHTAADRPRTTTYNAAVMLGGIATAVLGYGLVRAGVDSDGLGPILVGFGGAGIAGGAFMTIGGIAGLVFTELDYTPTHRF